VHASSFDQLGFGTLTFARDPVVVPTKPSALMASRSADKVILSWWGAAGAMNYNVKRSSKASGPFITIAVSDHFSYTDTNLAPGTYYYVVTGLMSTDTNETAPSNIAEVSTVSQLYMQLNFDQTSGITAGDTTGNGE
jgi:fibronectin type 3 domain-containing protein